MDNVSINTRKQCLPTEVTPAAHITKPEPKVHISHINLDNAGWTLKLALAKLNHRKRKHEQTLTVSEKPSSSTNGKRLTTLFKLFSEKNAPNKPSTIQLIPPSFPEQAECHIPVPSGDIKKALNNPRPQLLVTRRVHTAPAQKRMKFTSKYDDMDCTRIPPTTLASSSAPPPPTTLSATTNNRSERPLLCCSRPSDKALHLIPKHRIFIPAPNANLDSPNSSVLFVDTRDKSSSSSIDSIASALSSGKVFSAIAPFLRRRGTQIALVPVHIGRKMLGRWRMGGEDEEVWFDLHGCVWRGEGCCG
jgi:hypothetical protein